MFSPVVLACKTCPLDVDIVDSWLYDHPCLVKPSA